MPTFVPTSSRYRALIQLLRTAEDLWNASRVFFSRWDLSPSQFNVLNLLYGEPEGLSQSDLSRLLIMHRSNATGLVDRLVHRGLVRREDDAKDRRAYRVLLTPAATTLLERIYPHYYAAADRIWTELPDQRITELVDELRSVAAHAGAVAVLANTPVASPPTPPRTRRNRPRSNPPTTLSKPPPSEPPLSPPLDESSLRVSDL